MDAHMEDLQKQGNKQYIFDFSVMFFTKLNSYLPFTPTESRSDVFHDKKKQWKHEEIPLTARTSKAQAGYRKRKLNTHDAYISYDTWPRVGPN